MYKIQVIKKIIRKYIIPIIVATLSVLLLFSCFTSNSLAAAPDDLFKDWQRSSESFVLGRMIKSQQSGVFSDYGVLEQDPKWATSNKYVSNQRSDDLYAYDGGMGLHGMGFSIFDRLTTFTNAATLDIIYSINCIILAGLITFIAMWAYFHYNLTSAILIVILSAFNVWLTISARNLYWVVWTLILPFCTVLAFLWLEEKNKKDYLWVMQLCIFLSVFMEVGCRFEFATSVLISMELPFIYYAIKNKWTIKRYFLRSLWAGISGLAAFITAISINLYQRAMLHGGFRAGIDSLMYNIDKRTGFFGNPVKEVYMNSLQTPVLKLISEYISSGTSLFFSDLRMDRVLVWLMFFTALIFISEKYSPSIYHNRAKLTALSATSWISLLSPISWFVLAKGHSSIHTHINYLLWSIPCLFLISSLGGAVAEYLTKDILSKIKNQGTKVVCMVIMCVFVFAPFYRFYNVWDWKENLKVVNNVLNSGEIFYSQQGQKIIFKDDKLYYFQNKNNVTDETFFLYIEPENINDLPTERIKSKFDYYEFYFATKKIALPVWSEYSVAQVYLPTYAIKSIMTGQCNMTGWIWQVGYGMHSEGVTE